MKKKLKINEIGNLAAAAFKAKLPGALAGTKQNPILNKLMSTKISSLSPINIRNRGQKLDPSVHYTPGGMRPAPHKPVSLAASQGATPVQRKSQLVSKALKGIGGMGRMIGKGLATTGKFLGREAGQSMKMYGKNAGKTLGMAGGEARKTLRMAARGGFNALDRMKAGGAYGAGKMIGQGASALKSMGAKFLGKSLPNMKTSYPPGFSSKEAPKAKPKSAKASVPMKAKADSSQDEFGSGVPKSGEKALSNKSKVKAKKTDDKFGEGV